ncbi:MAG: Periplasmic copper-binding protein (NosD) [Candidatus Bathyarchaeota archaeon BA2]|nr:MAG: Periplasmic copper-binding protein (NosD) [Candidatus Bathyarchaeota archaeon BA2]
MTSSENNVISNNLIKNNERAITLGGSSNKIYHNDFIDNTSPGFVIGENNNVWDDGYPSGGNYWSDYTGVDADGDGIGDTAYAAGGIIDRYPLMSPTSGLEIPTEEVPPPIKEAPPFWMEWWFLTIAVVAIGVVLALFSLETKSSKTLEDSMLLSEDYYRCDTKNIEENTVPQSKFKHLILTSGDS